MHQKRKRATGFFFAAFLFFIFAPLFVSAQIIITEIMYDPEGADADHEWIEIYNNGGSETDISGWKFYENETNHGLSAARGSAVLGPGNYAIIADNADVFLASFPSYTGPVFDSSFSLKNTDGEEIALKDDILTVVDSVTYDPALGGAGDGTTLQKVDGTWVAGLPTPSSAGNGSNPAPSPNSQETKGNTTNAATGGGYATVEPQFSADAGGDKTVVVGADTLFAAKAYGLKGEPLTGARFLWNFGDGTLAEGQKVFHHYAYPGTYRVILEVSSGKYNASDRVVVLALTGGVTIAGWKEGADGFIKLRNTTEKELDISHWILETASGSFIIPEGTMLLSRADTPLPAIATGLSVQSEHDILLRYPNGALAAQYGDGMITETVTVPPPTPVAKVTVTPPVSESGVQSTVKKQMVSEEKPVSGTAQVQTAAAETPVRTMNWQWLLALSSVITIAIAGVLFVRYKESQAKKAAPQELSAEDFEIVD